MRLPALTVILALSLAPASARADDASRLALAKQLMDQIHVNDTMRALLPLMAAQMRTTLAQRGQRDQDADAFVTQFQARAGAEIGRYTDMMAEAYAQEFTDEELQGILAFDRTALGQKLIAKTPELTQASMLAGNKLGREVGKEVLDDMQAKKDKAANQQKL